LSELPNSIDHVRVFNACSHPNVVRPLEEAIEFEHAVWSLGQDLKSVLRTASHDIHHTLNEVERDIFVKEVAHRVHKDYAR